MGFALDPSNPLYEAGKDATATVVRPPVGTASDIDLDLGEGGLPRVSTDIMLDAGAVEAATVSVDTSILGPAATDTVKMEEPLAAPMPDFTLEVPPAGASAETDIALEAGEPARDSNVIDFQIELPKAAAEPATVVSGAVMDAGLDFKIEGLDLKLEKEAEPTTMPSSAAKDGHWYDVQTKFDLAKAYQEMGDRDGAREILQEVIKEGDGEQQAQAQKLLDSLG
jgi:pilus assembly protein FimV